MALVKPIIIQVVGFQNSGKTTFALKLIKAFSQCGLKTVTIKHHGHGGKPEVPEQKDSTKHICAGASATIVEGEGRLILQAENNIISLDDQVRLLRFFQPDVILIEGYKKENYPKLLLIRDASDVSLITSLNNIKLILCWEEELKNLLRGKTNIPVYSYNDDAVELVVSEIKNKAHNKKS